MSKEFVLSAVLFSLLAGLIGSALVYERVEAQRFIDEARAMDHLGDHLEP